MQRRNFTDEDRQLVRKAFMETFMRELGNHVYELAIRDEEKATNALSECGLTHDARMIPASQAYRAALEKRARELGWKFGRAAVEGSAR